MVEGICDIDKQRLATRAVIVRQGNREMELELCEYHYNQLRLQQELVASPSDEEPRGSIDDSFSGFISQLGFSAEGTTEPADIGKIVSDDAKESIQHAAQTAVTFGRREMGTEHLLHALAGNDSIKKLLGKSRRKTDAIRTYIETNALKTDRPANPDEPIELTVSPHMKIVLDTAIQASRDLGHKRVEPEHLLIGIAQESEGMGGEVLRSYGLSAKTLRRKSMQQAKG